VRSDDHKRRRKPAQLEGPASAEQGVFRGNGAGIASRKAESRSKWKISEKWQLVLIPLLVTCLYQSMGTLETNVVSMWGDAKSAETSAFTNLTNAKLQIANLELQRTITELQRGAAERQRQRTLQEQNLTFAEEFTAFYAQQADVVASNYPVSPRYALNRARKRPADLMNDLDEAKRQADRLALQAAWHFRGTPYLEECGGVHRQWMSFEKSARAWCVSHLKSELSVDPPPPESSDPQVVQLALDSAALSIANDRLCELFTTQMSKWPDEGTLSQALMASPTPQVSPANTPAASASPVTREK
jgi:hypothetical protein